jgi:hypothetical protein
MLHRVNCHFSPGSPEIDDNGGPSLARRLVMREIHLLRTFAFAVLGGSIYFSVLAAQQIPQPTPSQPSLGPDQVSITIPDGTPVEMRFAQAVRGKMLDPVDVGTEARPGDSVRLVAVSDLQIRGLIVIAKGAMAEASVTTIKRPLTTLVATGLGLKLDWIEDVTGAHVLLRPTPKGEPQAFMAQVLSTPGGVVARPETLRGDIVGKNAVDISQVWRGKHYIPAGTRLTAYVDGSPALDVAKVQEAQARVSYSEAEADVTIYRTKGQGSHRPRVLCDASVGRRIGEREYIHLNLAPGKHSCQIETQSPKEISVDAGQEYFLHLRRSGSGWELKQVSVGEGEDSVENADPAPQQ